MDLTHVAVIFHHIGPYHHARLSAAAKIVALTGIEWSEKGSYDWGIIRSKEAYKKISLFSYAHFNTHPNSAFKRRLLNIIRDIMPDVVAVNGWNDFGAINAFTVCLNEGIPFIVMSDSTVYDFKRVFWKEYIKKKILCFPSSALVAGTRHQEYLELLGFTSKKIYHGYDVVDNHYFALGADQARNNADNIRTELAIPRNFFLASNRFIEKKNLPRLLDAYARYRHQAGESAWKLVLLGDGPLKPNLQDLIDQQNLSPWVLMPGFKQYDELPAYYGLAGAFIHASTTEQWGLVVNEAMAAGLPVLVSNRCGCAPDLVEEGRNGYTFDPYDVDALAGLMLKIAAEDCDRAAMGQASREIISRWNPETFAKGLIQAVEYAMAAPLPKASMLDKALLWALGPK